MSKIVKIFNELIKIKLSPLFGEVLLDCKLIGRDYRFGDYRYDLLFIFEKEFNNPKIQIQSVFETCDDLFNWVDLRDLPNLSIVIMNKFGRNQHYSYFELMHEIIHSSFGSLYNHPMYQKYREWESNKLLEERRRRDWEMEMGTITRNYTMKETRMTESKKKKFLFW